jgi:hypothetical protein
MTPDLEAHGPYVVARRGDTTQQVADCSVSPHGAEYARLFAASQKMLAALQEVELTINANPSAIVDTLWCENGPETILDCVQSAIAAATGKGESS